MQEKKVLSYEAFDDRFMELLLGLANDRIKVIERQHPLCNGIELLTKIGQVFIKRHEVLNKYYAAFISLIITEYFNNNKKDEPSYINVRNEIIFSQDIILIIEEELKKTNIYKSLREANNYTIKELSLIVNKSINTIKKWEQGLSYPKLSTLIILAELYQTPISEFLYEKNKKT